MVENQPINSGVKFVVAWSMWAPWYDAPFVGWTFPTRKQTINNFLLSCEGEIDFNDTAERRRYWNKWRRVGWRVRKVKISYLEDS